LDETSDVVILAVGSVSCVVW